MCPFDESFGPEHGIDATAQDMISVDEAGYEMTIETVSLYGETEDSLHPNPETLGRFRCVVVRHSRHRF